MRLLRGVCLDDGRPERSSAERQRLWLFLRLQGLAASTGADAVMDVARMAMDDDEAAAGGDADSDADVAMDVDPVARGGGRKGKYTEAFKEKVIEVLRSSGFENARSAKLTQDDFLRLLAVFNKAGIHFA